MAYHSILDRIEESKGESQLPHGENYTSKTLRQFASLRLTVEYTLNRLEENLSKSDARTPEDLGALVMDSAHIMSSVINHNLDTRVDFDLLEKSKKLAFAVYRGDPSASSCLDSLKSAMAEKGFDLKRSTRSTGVDSCRYTNSAYANQCAQRIEGYANGDPILFIPLAHGSLALAIDVYLRFVDSTGKRDSIFHPIKGTRREYAVPPVQELERAYLSSSSESRKIALFDELTSDGTTMDKAYAFFDTHLPRCKDILLLTASTFHPTFPGICEVKRRPE